MRFESKRHGPFVERIRRSQYRRWWRRFDITTNSYVQFRAIVLVYGFAPPDIRAIFEEALDSSNDRVRAAGL